MKTPFLAFILACSFLTLPVATPPAMAAEKVWCNIKSATQLYCRNGNGQGTFNFTAAQIKSIRNAFKGKDKGACEMTIVSQKGNVNLKNCRP